MGIQDLTRFSILAEACESRYVAVRWLAKASRQLSAEYIDYELLESKLLTWLITGECPYTVYEMDMRKLLKRVDALDDLLEYVTDEEVETQVRLFYKKSIKNKKLTLCDKDDLGSSRLSRVNILLRMAWS